MGEDWRVNEKEITYCILKMILFIFFFYFVYSVHVQCRWLRELKRNSEKYLPEYGSIKKLLGTFYGTDPSMSKGQEVGGGGWEKGKIICLICMLDMSLEYFVFCYLAARFAWCIQDCSFCIIYNSTLVGWLSLINSITIIIVMFGKFCYNFRTFLTKLSHVLFTP